MFFKLFQAIFRTQDFLVTSGQVKIVVKKFQINTTNFKYYKFTIIHPVCSCIFEYSSKYSC